jgi:hypothetical protein
VFNAPSCSGGAVSVNYFGSAAKPNTVSDASLVLARNNFTRCTASPFESDASVHLLPQLVFRGEGVYGRGGALSVMFLPGTLNPTFPSLEAPVIRANVSLMGNNFVSCTATAAGGAIDLKMYGNTAMQDSAITLRSNTFVGNAANLTYTPAMVDFFKSFTLSYCGCASGLCRKGFPGGNIKVTGGAVAISSWWGVTRFSLSVLDNIMRDNVAVADVSRLNAMLRSNVAAFAANTQHAITPYSQGGAMNIMMLNTLNGADFIFEGNEIVRNEQRIFAGDIGPPLAPLVNSANAAGGGGLNFIIAKLLMLGDQATVCNPLYPKCISDKIRVRFDRNKIENNIAQGSGGGARIFVGKAGDSPFPCDGVTKTLLQCKGTNNTMSLTGGTWANNIAPEKDSKGGGLLLVLGDDKPKATAGNDNIVREFTYSWTASVTDETFIGNKADCLSVLGEEVCEGQGQGGGIALQNGKVNISGGSFLSNSAGWAGGGISSLQGSGEVHLLRNSRFEGNTASLGSAFASNAAQGSLNLGNVSMQMERGSWGVFVSGVGDINADSSAVLSCRAGSLARVGGDPCVKSTSDGEPCIDAETLRLNITRATDYEESRFVVFCEACSAGRYSLQGGTVSTTDSCLVPHNRPCNRCPCKAEQNSCCAPHCLRCRLYASADPRRAACPPLLVAVAQMAATAPRAAALTRSPDFSAWCPTKSRRATRLSS